jgi:hypothetical protein
LFFQIIGFGTVREIEEAEAGEQIEVRTFQADPLSQLGSAGQLLVQSDN